MEKDMLMKIDGAPSRYMTWVDYSIRMKQSTVSIENYELFYRKYYGFVIGFCRRKYHLNDWQIGDILDPVFKKFFANRKEFDRSKGRFHSWFATMIDNIVKDYLKAEEARTSHFKDEDGRYANVDVETIGEDEEKRINAEKNMPDDDGLWDGYLAFLAWEEVAAKSSAEQVQCFLWRHNNGRKPAEIAKVLGITSLQVSENIRAFKDKLVHAMRNLDETYDCDQTDWDEIKRKADSAKKKYLAIAEAFPIMGEA